MKTIGWAIVGTGLIFFMSILIIAPIISNLGYSSVESSYHLWTHGLLVSIILTIIVCTMILMEEIGEIKKILKDGKKEK